MERHLPVSQKILSAFGLPGDVPVSPIDSGHINDTFLAAAPGERLVIQRINRNVFPSPPDVMENIVAVTDFLRRELKAQGGDPDRETLTVRRTVDGGSFVRDENGEYWRCTVFIEGASSFEVPEGLDMLREAGLAFGRFMHMLSNFPADSLHTIIPDFHNTPVRFRQLADAAARDAAGRKSAVKAELAFAGERERACGLLMGLLEAGKLPLRVTHNDTKMSNILMDGKTGKAVCVIDLDTVMPGLTAFDFGDSIRAGASTAAEDETDLSRVRFDLDRYEAYTRGFLSAAGDSLTPEELRTLPDGAIWMTFEVGIRFLADYLNGDRYFRTAYPSHNLDRARNQFKLVRDMEEKRAAMDGIVRKCI